MATDRKALTKTLVEGVAPQPGRDVFEWDRDVPGFGVKVTPGGKRVYVYQYRAKGGQQRRMSLGVHGALTVQKARAAARDAYEAVRRGNDPVADDAATRAAKAAADSQRRTVADVLDDFMQRHGRTLRSAGEYRAAFERLVKPAIGSEDISTLRRGQIAKMLDTIEDENGPVMADRCLAYTRSAFNWHEARDDTFTSPIAKRMARTKPRERARTRILADDEIRALWAATEGDAAFGAYVRVLLLSAQRRSEVAHMQRKGIAADGTWTIPAGAYKTKREHVVPLPKAALDIIEAQPARADGYVFSPNLARSGKPKARLDRALPLPAWTLHDLRRTARSLMSRAGVSSHVAERVLGHVIAGVEGVYDRHNYEAEKRAALETLAAQVERILHPVENVVELRAG